MQLNPYVSIARPDDWVKNIFLVPGIVLVYFFDPGLFTPRLWVQLLAALVAACLIASSNYVLNELLDADKDLHHPTKRHRPIPSGQVKRSVAWVEWLLLGTLGLWLGFAINSFFGWACFTLWLMGCIYNIPPIRSKDLPYVDVLSESLNNPIRLCMGWYATGCLLVPPLTVMLAYWMFGAFMMGIKRFAEFRHIDDPAAAARYRRSFAHYTEQRLMESTLFYATLFAMLSGIFIARYHLELVLATPFVALAMTYYVHLGYKPNSPVQYPERLYKAHKLMALSALAFLACMRLLFVNWPAFTRHFEATPIRPSSQQALAAPTTELR